MPSRYQFVSPGAAVTDSITQFLAEREARRRQEMLDEITRKNSESQIADREAARKLQQAQIDAFEEQRAAATEANRLKLAQGVAESLLPGQEIDQETASTLQTGKLGSLVTPGGMRGTGQPDDTGGAERMDLAPTTFRGTPKQLEEKRLKGELNSFLNDPDVDDSVKKFVRARMSLGEALPYQLFDPNQGKPNVGTFEDYATQRFGPRPTPAQLAQARKDWAEFGRDSSADDTALLLTDAGRDAAAIMYAKTGQLPPMGMGRNTAGVRTTIINRAAEMFPDLDIAANKAGFTADQGSLTQIQKSFDAVEAFSKTVSKNSELLKGVIKTIPESGIPYLNQPFREAAKGLGNREMARFRAIRQSVQNEYARIISQPNLSGVLSDSARAEAETILSEDSTVNQMLDALEMLELEARNRRDSYSDQIGEIKGRIKTDKSGGASASKNDPAGIR